jgi:hypothetical protein
MDRNALREYRHREDGEVLFTDLSLTQQPQRKLASWDQLSGAVNLVVPDERGVTRCGG